jgi:lipoprotein-anchoring transpeptidase ErfK/SrfK
LAAFARISPVLTLAASERNPDMQPFARPQEHRIPLYWWITGAGAILFTLWALDLFPHVHKAPTGEVAGANTNAASETISTDDTLPGDWTDVTDTERPAVSVDGEARWSGLSEPPQDTADPDSTTESASVDTSTDVAVRLNARRRPVRDQAVRPAGYEASPRRSPQQNQSLEASDGLQNSQAEDSAETDQATGRSQILPSDFGDTLQSVRDMMRNDQTLDAHAELSRLYWKYPAQRQTLRPLIKDTATKIFTSADYQFGEPHIVEYGETLERIGRQYEVPWQYLAKLNSITPAKLQAGQQLKVVRGPFGAVVDLSTFTLTIHAHGWYVQDYRIGVGRDGKTPVGRFEVHEKLENPVWYDPDGGVVEADDPENPLGEYWLGLGNHIGIHGTIDPATIGRAASRGCIHLGDKDIREVFELLGTGSEVTIRK